MDNSNRRPAYWEQPHPPEMIAAGRPSIFGPIISVLLTPLALVLCVVLLVVALSTTPGKGDVYLVGGLEKSYKVKINGTPYTVTKGMQSKLDLDGTTIVVEPEGAGAEVDFEPQTFEIEGSFWKTLFDESVYVVNPDRMAVLQVTTMYPDDPEYSYASDQRAGKVFHQFSDIDYSFTDPPSTANANRIMPYNVLKVSDEAPEDVIYFIASSLDPEEFTEYIHLLAERGEDLASLLATAQYQIDENDFLELLRPYLDERPLRPDVHVIYQDFISGNSRLPSEYQGIYDQNPDSADAAFLLARVTEDYEKSNALLVESVRKKPPNLDGAMAIARRLLARGDTEGAWKYAQPAYESHPKPDNVSYVWEEAALAAGEIDAVAEWQIEYLENLDEYEADMYIVGDVIALLAQLGRTDQAKEVVTKHLSDWSYGDDDYWKKYISAMATYGAGNYTAFVNRYEKVPYVEDEVSYMLWTGKLDEAVKNADAYGIWPDEALILYAMAQIQMPDDVVSKDALRILIENLEWEEGPYNEVVEMMKADAPPTMEQLLRLDLLPSSKRAVLVAVGARFPSIRDDCYALAAKMNFRREFPYYLVQRIAERKL